MPLFPGLAPLPKPASAPALIQEEPLDEPLRQPDTDGTTAANVDRHPIEIVAPDDRQAQLDGFEPVPQPRGVAATDPDYHMAIAWRLSKAMKGVMTGHRDARSLRRLTPGQRHQVGNVICGHLLASLRAQVEAESRES